jgi:hypothetical protein
MTGEPPKSLDNESLQTLNFGKSSSSQSPEFVADVSEAGNKIPNTLDPAVSLSVNNSIYDRSGVLISTGESSYVGATHW